MFGFALAVAYCPWITGAASTPRWCVLVIFSVIILSVNFNQVGWRTAPVVWGCAFLGWALAMSLFSSAFEAKDQAWKLALYAALFLAGGQMSSLRPLYLGAAAGVAISSVLVIADLAGLIAYQQVSRPSGLFVNGLYLAEFATMLLAVGLTSPGLPLWAYAALLPALLLGSVARGPLVALGVAGLIVMVRKSSRMAFLALGIALVVGSLLIAWRPATVWARLDLWMSMLPNIGIAGHGLGAFFGDGPLLAVYRDYLTDGRPLHANNDLIEIGYDLGIVGVILAVGFVASVMRGPLTAERLVILVFVVEGCFGFPFYLPWSAGLFCLAAGHAAVRSRVRLRAPDNGGTGIREGDGGGIAPSLARSPDGFGSDVPVGLQIQGGAGDAVACAGAVDPGSCAAGVDVPAAGC